jgi:hypothetical protein
VTCQVNLDTSDSREGYLLTANKALSKLRSKVSLSRRAHHARAIGLMTAQSEFLSDPAHFDLSR